VKYVRFSPGARHPEGMQAISPGSRSAPREGSCDPTGVGWPFLRPLNRWWRCAYHRLMALNPPGSVVAVAEIQNLKSQI
jgi:hypothetical protein